MERKAMQHDTERDREMLVVGAALGASWQTGYFLRHGTLMGDDELAVELMALIRRTRTHDDVERLRKMVESYFAEVLGESGDA
jgi:hypothetical protein